MHRLTAYFTGRVQGVGFRYTTSNIARRYAVAGFVKNLPDGRVELVAEGVKQDLQMFLDDIQASMSSNIHDTKSDMTPAIGEFGKPTDPKAFTVRH